MSFGRHFNEVVGLAVEFKDTYGMTKGLQEVFDALGRLYHSGYGTIDPTNRHTGQILACNSQTFFEVVDLAEGETLLRRQLEIAALGDLLKVFLDRGALSVSDRNRAVFTEAVWYILTNDLIDAPDLAVETALRHAEARV